MKEILKAASSPHIRHRDTTAGIMADVVLALLPAAIFGCILFKWNAVFVLLTTVISAVAAEYLWNLIFKKQQTIGDLSAVVTGLLLGMNLPSTMPLWQAAIGSVAAIIIVKQLFGGLGFNFVNPAIAARIILLVSFPTAMTKFVTPITGTVASATPLAVSVASATPLNQTVAMPSFRELFFGIHAGTIGETSAFLLLIGGVYLCLRRVITPIIPVCFIGSLALLTFLFGENPLTAILMGGVMLGAIFMATDYVTSPASPLGKIIFGIGCGTITFIIRKYAALPEGVSYAIILMNILTPHIDNLTKRKPFGAKEAEQKS